MNKQELIDKAVKSRKGLIGKENESADVVLWDGNEFYLVSRNYARVAVQMEEGDIICSRAEFEKRAKELGWINGYKWGVEYPTNGEKPDLPDDLEIKWLKPCGKWSGKVISGYFRWKGGRAEVTKFRIVDERYKPVSEISEKQQNVSDLPENNQKTENVNDWYKRGELPPVDSEIEVYTEGEEVRQIHVVWSGDDVVFGWDMGAPFVYAHFSAEAYEFRPIKSEREKFVEKACLVVKDKNHHLEAVFGQLFDAGFKAPN